MNNPTSHDGAAIRRRLAQLFEERILILDGAMGTAIQDLNLSADDFGGDDFAGCNEYLVLKRPDLIRGIHRDYLQAGADLIETNTFGATPLVLDEYAIGHLAEEINKVAAELARQEADRASTAARPRFVVGSMGPTTKTLTVTGGVTFAALQESYRVQARGLLRGGSDILILETVQDTLNLKAGYLGILQAFDDSGITRPIALSCTIEPMGTMLAGQGVEAFYASVEHIDPIFVGMNCSTGPRFMTDHLRTLSNIASCAISCFPNAGLPNSDGKYEETPQSLSADLGTFIAEGWVNIIGGCCGTTGRHICAIHDVAERKKPRRFQNRRRLVLAGIDSLAIEKDAFPIIVGERTNVIGSRQFKKLIAEGEFEKGAELGRAQVRGGAHILDVCMADPDRVERDDVAKILALVTRMIKVPIMIDSTDAAVLEQALKMCQGKSIINSINLEDGEERFERVVPLARRLGAALVVGCIDEDPVQGMAVTAERKLAVARRSHELLTKKYGVPEEDLIFDPLVFPAGTGDQNYTGSAKETIEGVRAIASAFPRCQTILGISNVSFGLPPAGREVLNSVFLYHCVKAGLSFAIVNSQKLERFASIPEADRAVCEDLLLMRRPDAIEAFNAHFGTRKEKKSAGSALLALPLDKRLATNIIEGTKEGLEQALTLALEKYPSALEVINGPLMDGMSEVGRLFNNNELIVAEVLQSAEAMKAAVAFLEPHMEKAESNSRGRILLATVKGDVHDIGKNLVHIILGNNGYEIVNLGIKVPPAALIEAVREHKPHAIGLSGLLVKSAQQMVVTAQDLDQAGIDLPILVGGAALTPRFTATQIAAATRSLVVYASDAMHGLDIANKLLNKTTTQEFVENVKRDQERLSRGGSDKTAQPVATFDIPARSPDVEVLAEVPRAPSARLHVETGFDVQKLYQYINPQMLYCRHLGLRGSFEQNKERRDERTLELERMVLDLVAESSDKGMLRPRALWRFFPVSAAGDHVTFHDPETLAPQEVVSFPRQQRPPFLCLADYVKPGSPAKPEDQLALFVTTCGAGVRALANKWIEDGAYLRAHALQALAVEMAEALAEQVHQKLRKLWGFADPAGIEMPSLWKAKYRGKRYSFGYPACPDLSQQRKLWNLLHPEDHIGVELTDGYMMDPEASVSALVFHHPQAFYFAAG